MKALLQSKYTYAILLILFGFLLHYCIHQLLPHATLQGISYLSDGTQVVSVRLDNISYTQSSYTAVWIYRDGYMLRLGKLEFFGLDNNEEIER